jgi:hypothetical protein
MKKKGVIENKGYEWRVARKNSDGWRATSGGKDQKPKAERLAPPTLEPAGVTAKMALPLFARRDTLPRFGYR